MFRITYVGSGVMSNRLGAFQNGTTARTDDEQFARKLAADVAWTVTDQDGTLISQPAKKAEAPEANWESRPGKKQRKEQAETAES